MRDGSSTAPRAGRLIAWTAAAALACWGATLAMVRAVAQQSPPPAPPAAEAPTAGDPDSNEEVPGARPRAPVAREELPEYRDSADNNITFPVDI